MLKRSEWCADNPGLVRAVGESVIGIAGGTAQVGSAAEIAVYNEPRGIMADRLRFLRAHLRSHWSADKLKTLLITSPLPHDGKSTVALNLAIILAEKGKRRVLLIEGDLHHPSMTERLCLGFRTATGLAECLEGKVDPFTAIWKIDPLEIYLLPAGTPSSHPTELLQGDALPGMMQSVREHFDWVVVDAPPVQPLSDALLLRQRTDATLLVIRAGHTSRGPADEAVALLGKKSIFGMILNGVEGMDRTYSQYYGAYGSAAANEREK